MKPIALLLAAALVLTLVVPTGAADGSDPTDIIGKPAPAIKGDHTLNGKVASLADLKGKVVVLHFTALWCEHCTESLPEVAALHKKYKDNKDVAIVGVTSYFEKYVFDKEDKKLYAAPKKLTAAQEQATVKDFSAHHKLEHPILFVPAKEMEKVKTAYHIDGFPEFVIINPKGEVYFFQSGFRKGTDKRFSMLIDKLLEKR